MAEKAYVEVASMKVEKAFDNAYKSSLPKIMKAAAEKTIDHTSNLTTTKPAGPDAKGFCVIATLNSLVQSKDQKDLEAKMTMTLSTWPEGSMFGFLNGGGKSTVSNPKKIDADVNALVGDIIESLISDKVAKAIRDQLAKAP